MDMVGPGKPADSVSGMPNPRRQSWYEQQRPRLDSSAVAELGARVPRLAEAEGEAPGPLIIEIGEIATRLPEIDGEALTSLAIEIDDISMAAEMDVGRLLAELDVTLMRRSSCVARKD